MRRFLISAVLLLVPGLTFAQTPLPKVPPGFTVELVAKAPDIEHPTALAVAPNGDVYVAEDPMDMRGPSNKPADKIWLLKDGDPKIKVLIADKLWAVMGLELVRDKLFCVHYPFVSVFTLDADGKAIERVDLFNDLGPKSAPQGGFNDHVPSGIHMGMDGWLYVSIGDKGIPKMTKKEKDQGSVHVAEGRWRYSKEGNHISMEGGGVIRFRPDGSGLEVFASGTRNHLDVPMDEHDRIFVRDNTDDGDGWNTRFMYLPRGAFMGYPWAFTQRPKETLPMIHDFGGGSPCGGFVYCDDGLPEQYRGRVFHCEWGQGKVWAVKVVPDGAGFKYVDQIAFMNPTGTSLKDFRPFTLRPTADGRGFYVTDWAFGGWMQKQVVGRLWKVTYNGNDVKPAPRGKDADSTEELIKSLGHPALTERLRAQRALEQRGNDAVARVQQQVRDNQLSPRALRHALWILAASPQAALSALNHPDEGVRLEALRVLSPGNRPGEEALKNAGANPMQRVVADASPQVRLHAASALATKTADPVKLLDLLALEKDQWVRFALVRALKQCADWRGWADESNKTDMANRLGQPLALQGLLMAAADAFDRDAVRFLAKLSASSDDQVRKGALEGMARSYKDRRPYAGGWWGTRPEKQKPPARVVAWEGTTTARAAIVKALGDKVSEVRLAAITALVSMNDPETFEPIVAQFDKETDPAVRADLIRAVGGQKSPAVLQFLARAAQDETQALPVRLEAVIGLEKMGSPPANGGTPNNVTLLRDLAAASPSSPLRVRAFEALGNLKAKSAEAVCIAALSHNEPAVRHAAVVALGKIGSAAAADKLLPVLADGDMKVKLATIAALGDLKAAKAVPALLPLVYPEATQFDAITALAKMPDSRALAAYLTGLASKNVDVRTGSRKALTAIRGLALPTLKELAERNELPADLLPELRSIYAVQTPILTWKVIGPFANDDKSYPPEKEQKFDAVYQGVEGQVQWRDRQGNPKRQGMVDLQKLYKPSDNVVIYAVTTIESTVARDALFLVGSDDTITMWLNGVEVHKHATDRGWQADSDKVKVKLQAGKNILLVKVGNTAGAWAFSVSVSGDDSRYAFLQGGKQKFNLDVFRSFARTNDGEAARGEKLFRDVKGLACIKCHAVSGQGGAVGPDLAGIALRFKKDDLITSILEPSKQIANGYETHVITTVAGKTITGIFKGDDSETVNLMDPEGKLIAIPKKDIDQRTVSPISTMPNGLNEGMTLQDFADVIAYLQARREESPLPKK
jgi:putative heme-binding domain-containing protein